MTAERKYTLREALHVLADALADSISPEDAANDGDRDTKPENVILTQLKVIGAAS